jgi:uncharacterized membrane protein
VPPGEEAAAISESRAQFDRRVVAIADPILTALATRWLLVLNALTLSFVGGAFAAPLLAAVGFVDAANAIYDTYRAVCHQWAFRSFFLLGPQALHSHAELEAVGLDPFHFLGSPELGWKMAFCERDLAIFSGVLLFGLLYAARWRHLGMRPANYLVFAVLCLPMAVDGLTQLLGLRESTWELRVATGSLFGVASAWLLYPRLQRALQRSLEP